MARLTFRQGILKHAKDSLGTQQFIEIDNGNVHLVAAEDPTIITFAHGNTDYLFSEHSNTDNAWGPLDAGKQYWLYWELDKKSGQRTFGESIYPPIVQAIKPANPLVGQMWFNTANNRMYDYTANGWVEVIRVLACRVGLGYSIHSVSKDAPQFTGTQVGLIENVRVGSIVFDLNGYPIKKEDKTFFTTEDDFMTGLPSGASLRISNVTMNAIAAMPLAKHQIVQYSGFGRLVNATPYNQTEKLLGIVEHDAITGEDVTFSVEGMFFDDDWSWQADGATAGDPVYMNATGEVVLEPVVPNQYPIGIVIGPQEILFAPARMAKASQDLVNYSFEDLSNTPTSFAGKANYILRVNSTADGIEFVQDQSGSDGTNWGEITGLIGNQTDLTSALNSKAMVMHTHSKSSITDFAHTHSMADISDFTGAQFATSAQGVLADTALQPGDNITQLNNNAGYINTEADPIYMSQKGQPLGTATLDANGKILQSQIPSLAINNTFVVNNEVSMLAVPAETGDIAIRTDANETYILQGNDPTSISDWVKVLSKDVQVYLVDEPAPTLSADLNAAGNKINNVELGRYFETIVTPTVAATTQLDFSAATVFKLNLTQSTTLSIVNPPPANKAGSYTIVITQDNVGSHAVTAPATFTRGSMDIATGANQQTIVTLVTFDGGTNYTVMTAFKEGA